MSTPADPASSPALPGAVGVLLAAGAGRRMGRPKALVVGDDGEPWLVRGASVLQESGCADVVVVLGAEAGRARTLLANPGAHTRTLLESPGAHVRTFLESPEAHARALLETTPATPAPAAATTAPPTPSRRITIVVAPDWAEGIGASLRAGLAAAESWGAEPNARAPGDHARFAVVTLVDLPELRPEAIRRVAEGATETTLRQASYGGRPGHPVVIGAAHFAALAATLDGDVGARPYLTAHGVEAVDCTDLGGGDDVDAPPLRAG
ncbi:NTP transferase domain-containing protein [Herbiconiux sp. P17]|uniref:nucleotidyltransferase family protein n=1 Tax=Herbiconiux wuyangfengii TaxID=3342794 RepID=UPI0035BA451E